MVEELLGLECNVEHRDHQGFTAFLHTAKTGDIDMAELLLKHNCDITAVSKYGNSALHVAVVSGKFDFVKFLIKKGFSVDTKNYMEKTELNGAIICGHNDIVHFLISAGANVNNTNNRHRISPLMLAADRGDSECMYTLLLAGADIRLKDIYDNSALDHAVYQATFSDQHDVNCVTMLCAAGGDATNVVGWTLQKVKGHITLILEDQKQELQSLTHLCRKEIRSHLLSSVRGKHNNLFVAVPELPLPSLIKKFLLYSAVI